MKITKQATAEWSGNLKEGEGFITTESGALKQQPYGFNTRFEGTTGTNPEELIGAAHAGCFTMALSMILEEANCTAEKLETKAQVSLEKKDQGFEVTSIHLTLKAKVPGTTQAKFQELANKAKDNCPISKLFKNNAQITLEAMLEN